MSSGSMCIPDGGTWTLKTRNLSRFEITSSQFHPTPGRYVELQETDTGVGMPVYLIEKLGTKQGWSNPAPDEYTAFGYPQEIQDFMEAIAADQHPKSSLLMASDTVAALYAAYVSAERRGIEVDIPLDLTLE